MKSIKVVMIGLFWITSFTYVVLHFSVSNFQILFQNLRWPENKLSLDVIISRFNLTYLNDSRPIIKIIHQSWKKKDNIPKYFLRHVPSWKKCFPDWEYKFWTDQDNRDLIVEHYPWFLSKYDSFSHEIYRADCARYFYMFHYGGIYTDMDNECLRPFEHLLVNQSFVFGDINHVPNVTTLQSENYVQNSFMYSKPSHPFWLELVINIFNSYIESTADIVTGPLVLSNLIQKYRDRYPQSHGIKIYEGRYFNPITWGNQTTNFKSCKIWNGMSEKEYLECKKYHYDKGSYVIQYHSHTWNK